MATIVKSPPRIPVAPSILTINGGSSSIKFAVYQTAEPLQRTLHGKVERIGMSGTKLTFRARDKIRRTAGDSTLPDHKSAAAFLLDWLEEQPGFALGHRPWDTASCTGCGTPSRSCVTPELLDGTASHQPVRPRSSAARDRADRGVPPAASRTAAGGVLRHRVSPHHAACRQAAADPAALRARRASSATASTACPMPI